MFEKAIKILLCSFLCRHHLSIFR